jgi:hypothetical protein
MSIAYSGVPENKDTRLKLIQLLDECLQIRRSIRDLITSIKENLSNIKVPELENNINAKVNDLHQIVMNKDHTLRFLHCYLNPRGELLTVRDHLEEIRIHMHFIILLHHHINHLLPTQIKTILTVTLGQALEETDDHDVAET